MGTLINVGAILLGGIIGLFAGKLCTERLQNMMINVCGVCTLFIGISGALKEILVIGDGGSISTQGTMMMICCFAIGSLIGEIINISKWLDRFAKWLKVKSGSENDKSFVAGFVTTSMTVCIGAMAIVGSIQDGILHDPSTLIAKSILDFIIVIIMTASMGKGCIFSAIPVGILQGGVTLCSGFLAPVLSETAISNLGLVGSVMIFCVGLNLIRDKKVDVANMLPTLVVAVLWAVLGGRG